MIRCFIALSLGDRQRQFKSCAKGKGCRKEQELEEGEDDDLYYIHRLTLEAPGSGPRPYAKLKNQKGATADRESFDSQAHEYELPNVSMLGY